jgi:Uma2 family endonuclease
MGKKAVEKRTQHVTLIVEQIHRFSALEKAVATFTPIFPSFAPGLAPAAGSPPAFHLSVDQYDAMIQAGILTEDHKVELVGGVLFRKMPKKGPHSIASRETFKALDGLLPSGYFATREDPVRIPDYDEPEPDVSIIRGESRDYSIQPDASRVALVVEVSDATLAYDRGDKLLAYAIGGIPAYWIVNLVARQLEVYTEPSGALDPVGYRRCQVFGPTDQIELAVDGQVLGKIAVSDLLP